MNLSVERGGISMRCDVTAGTTSLSTSSVSAADAHAVGGLKRRWSEGPHRVRGMSKHTEQELLASSPTMGPPLSCSGYLALLQQLPKPLQMAPSSDGIL